MASITQWKDSLSYRTDEELQELENALDVLSRWEIFEREHPYMATLRTIVSGESVQRFMAPFHVGPHTCRHKLSA